MTLVCGWPSFMIRRRPQRYLKERNVWPWVSLTSTPVEGTGEADVTDALLSVLRHFLVLPQRPSSREEATSGWEERTGTGHPVPRESLALFTHCGFPVLVSRHLPGPIHFPRLPTCAYKSSDSCPLRFKCLVTT